MNIWTSKRAWIRYSARNLRALGPNHRDKADKRQNQTVSLEDKDYVS